MRTFKVIALSCNSLQGVLSSGQTVTEDAFEGRDADELVKEGFLEEVTETPAAAPKKETAPKKGGLVSQLMGSV